MTGKVRAGFHRGKRVFIAEGRDPLTGKRRRFYSARKSVAEATQKKWNAEEQDGDGGEPLRPALDPNVIVRHYVSAYLAARDPSAVPTSAWRPRTFRSVRDALEQHVLPFDVGPGSHTIGDRRVRDWSRRWLPLLAEQKRRDGYSRDSVRIMVQAASALVGQAVEDELLRYHPVDPAARKRIQVALKPTTDEQQEPVRAFEPDEARAFLTAARADSALVSMYTTGFLAGLRLGELCGLALDDDHMMVVRGQHVRQLRVERQLGQDQASIRDPQPTRPKSAASCREVNVGRDLGAVFDAIKADRKRLALERGWRPVPPWMFVTSNGTPYSERNVERDFQRVLGKAGLADRGLTPHSMRHTFAVTHILEGGASIAKWLQQQMGHSSIKITFDTYGKWFNLVDHVQADKIATRLLGGDTTGDIGL
jgi:integrase